MARSQLTAGTERDFMTHAKVSLYVLTGKMSGSLPVAVGHSPEVVLDLLF